MMISASFPQRCKVSSSNIILKVIITKPIAIAAMRILLLTRFTNISIAMIFTGSVFKIMHWPGSNQLIGLAIISIVILYSVHFSTKHPKHVLDWGKLLILILVLSGKLFRFFHWENGSELQYISTFAFLSFILYYITISLRSGQLSLDN
jgi:hypothetical protein